MADSEKNFFIQMEHDVMDFWEENKCFELLKKKNEGHERFRFLDGPITANNPMGIHHAWGRSLKDIFIRYKGLNGYDCRCQNGFDSQGLWVEVEVEKELGFKTKKDIEEYGMDKFTRKCVDRVKHFSGIITEQSKRLGQWMDWDNSYYTNTDKNIGGIWHFLKVCDNNGWIRREYKPMPWCPRCGTSLSEHEMTGSYKMLTHNSVFFKLPVPALGCKIIVWTTTPWTLSSNVALAVNPEIDYVEVKVASDEQHVILAKNAIKYLGEDKLEVIRGFKGSELVGLDYETCFPEIEAQQGFEHKIVAWEDVDAEEGTGVVHIAPGCGLEDFELGMRLGLPQIMPVDDTGIFLPKFGWFTGKDSHTVAPEVFERLEKANKLYMVKPHEHSYPVCWRCKSEVIFRLVPAWYISTDEIRPKLIEAASKVKWEPESNGKRMADWLNNMGDWNISRKRYYGMPLPFYPCECGEVTVIGSKAELKEHAVDPAMVDALPEMHRPWIDDIKIKCPHCGKEVSRVSEIGDVWLDAGIVPFSTFGYFDDKEEWRKNFPAEWVTEMREQVRLWFYSMLFMSTVLEGVAPYERVLSYNTVVSEDGSKFSKTGFMIKFDEAAEKIGADTVRYLYAGAPVANDVRFGFNLGDEARRKLLGFWNIYTFFDTYAQLDKPVFHRGCTPELSDMTPIDRWMTVRTNDFIRKATAFMDDYKAYSVVREFEVFVDDISNWYIRLNRRRFWKTDDDKDKNVAYWTLFNALTACVKVMAPIIPFMTEHIRQKLVREVCPEAELSVHLSDWAQPLEGFENDGIIEQTALARSLIAGAMRLRNEHQLKVRQPLAKLFVCCNDDDKAMLAVSEQNILNELNIKEIEYISDVSVLEDFAPAVNFKTAGAVLKQNVNKMKQTLLDLSEEDTAKVVAAIKAGGDLTVPGWEGTYPASLFELRTATKKGIVSAECGELVIAMDIVITPELRREGLVRDIVRQCQLLRKEAGYQVEQRIVAAVASENDEIEQAVREMNAHIAGELLADAVLVGEKAEADLEKTVEIAGSKVTLAVKKA